MDAKSRSQCLHLFPIQPSGSSSSPFPPFVSATNIEYQPSLVKVALNTYRAGFSPLPQLLSA